MSVIKKGDTGKEVKEVQTLLNNWLVTSTITGFDSILIVDGIFGNETEKRVKVFQHQHRLVIDGIVGSLTMEQLLKYKDDYISQFEKYPLKKYNQNTGLIFRGICLHHTASKAKGLNAAKNVVDYWNTSKPFVGTHFVVSEDKILQTMSLNDWAYHLAVTQKYGDNNYLNKYYIGIEVCNWGNLTYEDGIYKSWTGTIIPKRQVTELSFRGQKYFQRYSRKTLQNLEILLDYLFENQNKLGIMLAGANYKHIDEMFELNWEALNGNRKLTTHNNFQTDKNDMYPYPLLIHKLKKYDIF